MKYSKAARHAIQNSTYLRFRPAFQAAERALAATESSILATLAEDETAFDDLFEDIEVDGVNRMIKPRTGRPASNTRSILDQNTNDGPHQPPQSPFSNVDPNIVNGASAQQVNSAFGQSSSPSQNSTNSNIPPVFQNWSGATFGNASNNLGFNPSKSSFNFNPSSEATSFSSSNEPSTFPPASSTGPLFSFLSSTTAHEQGQQQKLSTTTMQGTGRRREKEPTTYLPSDSGNYPPPWAPNAPFTQNSSGSSTPTTSESSVTIVPPMGQQQPGQATSQVFGQPTNSAQPSTTSNIFGVFGQQPTQSPGGLFSNTPQAQSQQHNGEVSPDGDMMSTSPDNSPQTIDAVNRTSSLFFQPHASQVHNTTGQSQGGSLFDRITRPEMASPTPTTSSESNIFGTFNRPDSASTMPATSGPVPNIFEKSSNHPTNQQTFSFNQPLPAISNQESSGLEQLKSTSSTQLRETAAPISGTSQSLGDPAASENPFDNLPMPKSLMAPPSFPNIPSASMKITDHNPGSSASKQVNGIGTFITQTNSSKELAQKSLTKDQEMTMMPPTIPEKFTDTQRKHYVTRYRLRSLDSGLKRYILSATRFSGDSGIMRFYEEKKQEIVVADGLPLAMPARKRKAVDEGRNADTNAQEKRVHLNGPTLDVGGAKRPLFGTHPDSGKRKVDEELVRNGSSKKSRVDGSVSYPSLSNTQGSKTSHTFADIVNGDGSAQGQGVSSPAPSIFSFPTSSSNASAVLNGHPDKSSTTRNLETASNISPRTAAGTSSLFSIKPITTTASNPFSSKPSINTAFTPFSAAQGSGAVPSPFNKQVGISNLSTLSISKSSIESAVSSNTIKPPTFQVPNFGNSSGVNMMAQFGAIAKKSMDEEEKKEKEKRKADDLDSDEDPEEWERNYEAERQAKKQKIQELSKGQLPRFVPGKGIISNEHEKRKDGDVFTKSASTMESASFHTNQLKPTFSKGTLQVTNDQNTLQTSARSFSPCGTKESKASNAGSEYSGSEDSGSEDSGSEDSGSENSGSGSEIENQGEEGDVEDTEGIGRGGLFDRISKDEHGNAMREIPPPKEKNAENKFDKLLSQQTNIFGLPTSNASSTGGKQSNDKSASVLPQQTSFFSSSIPSSGTASSFAQGSSPSKKSNFFGLPSSKKGSLMFDQTPQDSNNIFGNSAGKEARSLFGKPSPSPSQNSSGTPGPSKSSIGGAVFGKASSGDLGSNLFGSSTSPIGDNTWKQDSPIKFTSTNNAPRFSITSATPSKASPIESKASPLTGLFGAPKPVINETFSKPLSNLFGAINTPNPAVGFSFGGPIKPPSSLLTAPSDGGADATSRASSPGVLTGGESANESTAEGGDDETEKHEQINLLASAPGEEDEDILFEMRAKASEFSLKKKDTRDENDKMVWISRGLGPLRVLKHRQSGKTRVILRSDPGGRIVINAALMNAVKYDVIPNKAIVKVAVATDAGKLQTWTVQVKTKDDAARLSRILEDNKAN